MTRLRNKLSTVREQVEEAYKNGATLRQIGDVHDCSPGTVRNILEELGVTLRSRGRRKKVYMNDPRILPIDNNYEGGDEAPSHYEGGTF
jgi:hypothetical protein